MTIVPQMRRGGRLNALTVALSLVLLAPLLGCQQLSPEQQRVLEEYRRSNVGPGAGTSP